MGLALAISGGVDRAHNIFVEFLNFDFIHLGEAFHDEGTDGEDVVFLKRIDVLNQRSG